MIKCHVYLAWCSGPYSSNVSWFQSTWNSYIYIFGLGLRGPLLNWLLSDPSPDLIHILAWGLGHHCLIISWMEVNTFDMYLVWCSGAHSPVAPSWEHSTRWCIYGLGLGCSFMSWFLITRSSNQIHIYWFQDHHFLSQCVIQTKIKTNRDLVWGSWTHSLIVLNWKWMTLCEY